MAEAGEHDNNDPSTPAEPDTGTSERSPSNVTQPLQTPEPPSAGPTATPKPMPAPASGGRRAPDVLTLVVGLMSLAAAVLVLAGWIPQLRLFDLRWVLSGGAVALGVLLLAASARSPRKR